MATGGIFQLITNDGKQDRMLMATALLNKRLYEIEKARANNPHIRDPTPTLVDIERTHILFMNAHFKPFAAIGYEYNRVRVQSGQARLGGTFQFSIPQFGDFFHDMVLRIRLGSVEAANATSNLINGQLRYIEFLGQRLVKNVKFQVNGNPLDEYDSDVHNFHEKFFVTPNKQVGWNRNVGQEIPIKGHVQTKNQFVAVSEAREVRKLVNGPQTAKATQPAVEMWIPLLFWFNKDPRLSIPSVSIPYGQRFIDITLARAAEILQHTGAGGAGIGDVAVPVPDVEVAELYINNIFVNPEIHDIYIKRIGFSLIRVHRRQTTRVNKSRDNILLNQLKWPIETLYVGMRPTENIDETDDRMLRSWHVYAQTVEATEDLCAVNGGVAVTGINLIDGTTPADGELPVAYDDSVVATAINAAINRDMTTHNNDNRCKMDYQECIPTLITVSIEAHGVPLYKDIPAQFFNSYVPYTYGGQHITTPDDCGALMITFNLYPGSYQPSGHVNISRAREFYLNYVSTINDTGPDDADLVVIAIAINFLLISDGSAVLRYST